MGSNQMTTFPNTESKVADFIVVKESERGLGEPGTKSRCEQLGTAFKTIIWSETGQPVKPEAEAGGIPVDTLEKAWALWAAAFICYLDLNPGKIYWRQKPELGETPEGEFYVWARLAVGNL